MALPIVVCTLSRCALAIGQELLLLDTASYACVPVGSKMCFLFDVFLLHCNKPKYEAPSCHP